MQCDHEDDKQVESLFKRIEQEQNGQLDILVNSAFKAGNVRNRIRPPPLKNFKFFEFFFISKKSIFENANLKFWETDPSKTWDDINNVGLRNNYICTVYASRLMVPRKQGLIVNISSLGGMQYAL